MLKHLSFEFFPPKTELGEQSLITAAQQLAKLDPEFFSVTFGAGGATREKTASTVYELQRHTGKRVIPHISCMGSSRQQISQLLTEYQTKNIKGLVVLRGDYPSGMVGGTGDFKYANELVAFIREQTGDYFTIFVAAYPEFHPEAKTPQHDFDHFQRKVKAGANYAITQYFFNVESYCCFRDQCEKQNITTPIIPGIMPIYSLAGLKRFSHLCGAELPIWLLKRLEHFSDETSLQHFAEDVVSRLCERLLIAGAPGLHFYTLNKAEPSYAIANALLKNSQRKLFD